MAAPAYEDKLMIVRNCSTFERIEMFHSPVACEKLKLVLG